MLLAGLALLVASWAQVDQLDNPPAKIARFLEHCETLRRGSILQVEHTLRGLRAGDANDAQTQRRIRRLEEQLRLLKSNRQPVIPELSFPPQTGAIGRLPGLVCHVEQVLSKREVLVRCSFPVTIATVRNFKRYRETVDRPVDFLIRGLPTNRFQEGADQEMLAVFEVIARETYQTETGRSRQLLVLKKFDLKAVEPYFKAQAVHE